MTPTPTFALAFAAGLLSFLSPCVLPLVPSYVSFIGGGAARDLGNNQMQRGRIVVRTIFFVAGFSSVFVALGALFTGSGMLFTNTNLVINIVAGSIVVALGLNIIFDFWKFLNIERRIHVENRPRGLIGALLFGMAFGAGWTPCIGPILAAILLLAGRSGSLGTGIAYLATFSLGLGLPFLLAGVFIARLTDALAAIRKHLPAIRIASGILIVIIGLLIALGRLQQIAARAAAAGAKLTAWDAAHQSASNWIFGSGILLISLLPIFAAWLRKQKGNPEARPLTPLKATLASAGVAVAVLNVADVVSVARWLSGWFQYTGL